MFTASLIVDARANGIRIDSFLLRHFRNYSKFRIQRMVQTGCARINGERLLLSRRVFVGQTIVACLNEPPDKLHDAEKLPLAIVYEDPWLIVVNKPPGIVAHPVANFQSGTLFNALQWHLDQQSQCRGLLRPGIVHRLDRMTSGLMVTVKNHAAHHVLSTDFQKNRVSKEYTALVLGNIKTETGTIDLPIGYAAEGRTVLMSCASNAKRLRKATTQYEVLQRFPGSTLVRAKPITGRNHQIRVHFAAIGHPLVGDQFYLAHGTYRSIADSQTTRRHALHANRLEFQHPILGHLLQFESTLPADLLKLCELAASDSL